MKKGKGFENLDFRKFTGIISNIVITVKKTSLEKVTSEFYHLHVCNY